MSLINPNNINGNFPVFGQDNPTQGFRDNFTNIKNNLNLAKQEIADLQDKAVLKTALSGTTLSNDLQGAVLENPQLKAYTVTYYDQGELSGNVAVDFEVGNFQKITTTGDINLSLANWPATSGSGVVGYASLRLWLVVGQTFNPIFNTNVAHSVTLPSSVSIGINDITGYVAATNTLTFDVPGNYIFDISSADGGETFLIFDNTRNRVRFRDNYFYFNPDVTGNENVLLLGWGDYLPLALSISGQNQRDTLSSKGGITVFESVLSHNNNLTNGDGWTGNLNFPNFSLSTTRSYIDGNGLPVVRATNVNDAIGYFNATFGSGNPANIGNLSLPEAGHIRFFANSSLPTYITSLPTPGLVYGNIENYSPGANIVISTKQDYGTLGQGSWPRSDYGGLVAPALSIENDQSVKFHAATVRNYQVVDLSAGSPFYTISPYISQVLLDNTDGASVVFANLALSPSFTLRDGQELCISSNVAIAALTVVPYTGNVTSQVTKQSFYAYGDGTYVTYVIDNSGFIFSNTALGGNGNIVAGRVSIGPYGAFTPDGFNTLASNVPNVIVSSTSTSVTIANTTAGLSTVPGTVSTWITQPGTTYMTSQPFATTITAGTSYKWIYRAANQRWYKIS